MNVTVAGVDYPLYSHVHHGLGLNDAFDASVGLLPLQVPPRPPAQRAHSRSGSVGRHRFLWKHLDVPPWHPLECRSGQLPREMQFTQKRRLQLSVEVRLVPRASHVPSTMRACIQLLAVPGSANAVEL